MPIFFGLALAFIILLFMPKLRPVQWQNATVSNAITSSHLSFANAVKRASPAVVTIYSETFTSQPRYMRGQSSIQELGSGVIMSDKGYILTNYHVINNADQVMITLTDGRQFNDVQLIGYDTVTDLALLKIEAQHLPVIPIDDNFVPQVGDVVEDVQIPKDGQNGLALTSISTSTAEVVYLQRNFNSVRIYVKILTGDWLEQSNIGRFNIRRLANTSLRGATDVDRVVGVITDINNSIVLGTSLIGKLLVFEHSTNLPVAEAPRIIDEEYWFFDENTEAGIERLPNPPFSLNKDYTQIYNIKASEFGTEQTLANEGAIAIYRRLRDGTYRYQHTLVSEYRAANRFFGSKVAIVQTGNYYTLLVGSDSIVSTGETDSTGRRAHPGTIEIFRHGTKTTDSFKGDYKLGQAFCKKYDEPNYVLSILPDNSAKSHIKKFYVK